MSRLMTWISRSFLKLQPKPKYFHAATLNQSRRLKIRRPLSILLKAISRIKPIPSTRRAEAVGQPIATQLCTGTVPNQGRIQAMGGVRAATSLMKSSCRESRVISELRGRTSISNSKCWRTTSSVWPPRRKALSSSSLSSERPTRVSSTKFLTQSRVISKT